MKTKKILLMGLSILTMLSLSACGNTAPADISDAQANIFQSLTIDKVNPLISETQGLVVLDVRTPAEYSDGHLADAINIDYEASDFAQKIAQLDKSAQYLVYCRSGRRSGEAVKLMKDAGFTKLYNMAGGINQWQSSGGQIVK